MLNDGTYFEWRAYEETRAALQARHPKARAAHSDLAKRYRDLADAISSHEERLRGSTDSGVRD